MAQDAPISEQKEWMARSTLKFFERHKDVMMARRAVHLGHALSCKVLAKTFEPVARDAHYITITARAILADRVSTKIFQEEEIFKAEESIHAKFTAVNDFLDRRIKQAEQKLQAAGEDPQSVTYPTRGYAALCSTRVTKEWLDLLKKADVYLSLLEYLWITGELSDIPTEALRAKLNSEREVRNQLHSIPRMTTAQYTIIRRICSGVIEQRQADRQAQSVRDKERSAAEKAAQITATQKEMNDLATGATGGQASAETGGSEASAAAPEAGTGKRGGKKKQGAETPPPAAASDGATATAA